MFKKVASFIMGMMIATASMAADITFDKDNVVVLRGEITSASVAKLSAQVLEASGSDLYLFISSPGGSILAGNKLVSVLKDSGKNVKCVVDIAASMAFVVLQACNERYILPHGIAMQHVASYSVEGNAPNNESMVKFLTDMLVQMDTAQAKRIGLSLEDFRAKTRNDWWSFGSDAVANGVADKVVTATCSPDLTRGRTKESIQVFIFSINVEWSNCPLISSPLKVGMGGGEDKGAPTRDVAREIARILDSFKLEEMVMLWYKTGKNPFEIQ